MDKEALRSHYKKLRRDFRQDGASERLTRHLQRLVTDLHVPDMQICLYQALADEAQFELEPVTDFFFPRIEDARLEFFRPNNARAFSKGRFGISEPVPAQSQRLDPKKPVVVVAPAVAVDTWGARLGLGKGYYDRFFSENPEAIRLAAVFHVQVSATALPRDAWDQPVDWVVTDEMILKISQKGVRSNGSQLVS